MTKRQVFRGRTLNEARHAAVQAFGGGAVLLTTREIRRPGLAGFFGTTEVEVVAAAPEPVAPAPPRANGLFAMSAYKLAGGAAAAPEPARLPSILELRSEFRSELRALKAAVSQPDRVPAEILAELAALRCALEESAPEPRKGDRVTALLRSRGIEGPVAVTLTRLLRQATGDGAPSDQLRDALAEVVKVAPWPLASKGRTLIALVGPTGVGKTTTAAKLAARARMEKRSVTLIACDGFRVGAVDQLRRYATLLGARFLAAHTRDELRAHLDEAETDLVIVDTAGRDPRADGPESLLATEAFGRSAAGQRFARHVLMCLPAALRAQDAANVARAFAAAGPTAVAVTKLDETSAPSGLLHGPAALKLPVSVLCAGQRVPEHIAPATAGAILDLLAPRRMTAGGSA